MCLMYCDSIKFLSTMQLHLETDEPKAMQPDVYPEESLPWWCNFTLKTVFMFMTWKYFKLQLDIFHYLNMTLYVQHCIRI
jgi:hypothetical protein